MARLSSSSSAKSLLILLAIISFRINSSSAARVTPQTSTEFIRSSCSTTTYPKLCFTSLSVHSSTIQTSPKLLTSAALNVALSSTKSTSTMMSTLSQSHGMKPRDVAAMRDCIEELRDAVDEIRRSIDEMSNFKESSNFQLMINDVQTWVSAAMTDESTCSDGFAGNAMNGNLRTAVRGRIVNVAQLTSNALALINQYSLLHG